MLEYHEALKKYLTLYETDFENIELNYNIGLCYLFTNLNKKAAIPPLTAPAAKRALKEKGMMRK